MWDRKDGAGLTLWSSPPLRVRSRRAAFSVLGRQGSGEWEAQKWRPCCTSPWVEKNGGETWRYFCLVFLVWEHGGSSGGHSSSVRSHQAQGEAATRCLLDSGHRKGGDLGRRGAVWHPTSRQLSYLHVFRWLTASRLCLFIKKNPFEAEIICKTFFLTFPSILLWTENCSKKLS